MHPEEPWLASRAMALDPRLPVIVGVGQVQRRPTETVVGLASPVEMMAEAARVAGHDSGTGDRLLREAGSVQVADIISWRYRNAAGLLAAELGASPKETVATVIGGNTPQMLVSEAALAIQRGEVDVVLIAGVEAMYTRRLAARTGETITWPLRLRHVAQVATTSLLLRRRSCAVVRPAAAAIYGRQNRSANWSKRRSICACASRRPSAANARELPIASSSASTS